MALSRKHFAAAIVGSVLLSLSATAAADVEKIVSFDPDAVETPESLAFDKHGNMYVSLALTGEVRKIAPNGTQTTLAYLPIASDLAPCENAFGMGIMGALALDNHRNVYVSVASCDPDLIGVWKVTQDGDVSQIASLPDTSLPNGIAYHGGRLYVADSNEGVVWRIDPHGCHEPEVWANDPLLEPLPDFFPGPNGLKVFENEVYVAVSDREHIVAIPIGKHGQAKQARVHASGIGLDDFSFDVHGNIYGTTDPFNTLVRVAPNGTVDVLLTADDGLDGPTSAVFGVKNEKKTLFITNGAFPFFSTTHDPSIMTLDIGINGYSH